MLMKSFIFIVLASIVQLAVQTRAQNVTISSKTISLNFQFNASRDQLHFFQLKNNLASNAWNVDIFMSIGNEIYKFDFSSETNSLVKIGRLTDFNESSENETLKIDKIEATKWNEQIIIIADVNPEFYFVYVVTLAPLPSRSFRPLQKIRKFGHSQSIEFLEFNQNIYCLLASNSIEEKSSAVRIFKWMQSFFQVVESIFNRNHKIDFLELNTEKQLVLIVDNKRVTDEDTVIQVHRYASPTNRSENNEAFEIVIDRLQDINVPYKLSPSNLFQFVDAELKHLHLIVCDANVVSSMAQQLCQFYVWDCDDVDAKTLFLEVKSFPLYDAISNVSVRINHTEIERQLISDGSIVVAELSDREMAIFSEQMATQASFSSPVVRTTIIPTVKENLLHFMILKRRQSRKFSNKLLEVHSDRIVKNGKIEFNVTTIELFDEMITVDAAKATATDDPSAGKTDKWSEINRAKHLLIDLTKYLVSQNEENIKPIQKKIDEMKKALKLHQALKKQDKSKVPKKITFRKVKINASNEAKIDKIVVKSTHNRTQTIEKTTKDLAAISEKVQKQQKIKRGKRNHEIGKSINVNRLIIRNEQNPFRNAMRRSLLPYRMTGKLSVGTLKVGDVSSKIADEVSSQVRATQKNAFHSKIEVESINGVKWDEFVSLLYRKRNNTTINGNLKLLAPTTIRSLFAGELNGVPPEDFLTLATDQSIETNVHFRGIHAPELLFNAVNLMPRFAENVALLGDNNVILSRVKIEDLNIRNSLQLADSEGEDMTQHIIGTRIEDLTQIYNGKIRIRGSLSLKNVLSDVSLMEPIPFDDEINDEPKLNQRPVNIFVNGNFFDPSTFPQQFWMKSVDQHFIDVNFTEPIETPQLNVAHLNLHPTKEYFILNEESETRDHHLPLFVSFEGLTTVANAVKVETTNETKVQKLYREVVMRDTETIMSETVTFRGRVKVDNIRIDFDTDKFVKRSRIRSPPPENEIPEMFSVHTTKNFTGNLFIEGDLIIHGNRPSEIVIDDFNQRRALKSYMDAITLVDRNQFVSGTFIFEQDLTVENLTVAAFIDNAGKEASGYDTKFDVTSILGEIFQLKENRIEHLIIDGNLTLTGPPASENETHSELTVQYLNGVKVGEYLPLVVLQLSDKEQMGEIFGKKTFSDGLKADYVSVSSFNRYIYVDQWMSNSLRSQQSNQELQQVIDGGTWYIGTLIAENLHLKNAINGVLFPSDERPHNASDVIIVDDDPKRTILINSALLFTGGVHIGPNATLSSLESMKPCDVDDLFGSNTFLYHRRYDYVNISGHINVKRSPKSEVSSPSLSEFFENSVCVDTNQTISAKANIHSDEIIQIGRIMSRPSAGTQINGIDLEALYSDAVTKSMTQNIDELIPVVFNSEKEFSNPYVELNGPQTICEKNIEAQSINDVDIKTLSNSLLRRQMDKIEIPKGQELIFEQPVTIINMTMAPTNTINDVPVNDIYFVYSNRTPPPISFAHEYPNQPHAELIVEDGLELNLVNDMSLKFFLENRVRLHSDTGSLFDNQLISGHLTFDELCINGSEAKIDAINDVSIDDVVVDNSDVEQKITGLKEIIGTSAALYVQQPFHATKINGIDVLGVYSKTVFLSQNQTIDQLILRSPYRLQAEKVIVANKFNGIEVPVDSATDYLPSARAIEVDNILKSTARLSSPRRLNYIDISHDFKIRFDEKTLFDANNVTDLRTTRMSIDSFSTEEFRGNNSIVSICPMQYHVQLKQSKTLHIRRSKVASRLLTVAADDLKIHIRTEFALESTHFRQCNLSTLNPNEVESDVKTVVFVNYQMQLRFPSDVIESAHVFTVDESKRVYLVLHFYNSRIAIWRHSRNSTVDELWQEVQSISLDSSFDAIFNAKTFHWRNDDFLAVAKSDDRSSFLRFYRFDRSSETFQFVERINDGFDILNSIEIIGRSHDEMHLILSKKGENWIRLMKAIDAPNLHHSNENAIPFEFTQQIPFESGIKTISTFSEFDIYYMAVVLSSGHFHIFQYRIVEQSDDQITTDWTGIAKTKWKFKMKGEFEYGKAMLPFVVNDKLYLFVLMNEKITGSNSFAHKNHQIAKVLTLFYYK